MVLMLVLDVNKGRRYVLPVCIRSGARERPGKLQLIAQWREQHKNEMNKV
jgi:hypothetical protein